MFNEIATTFSTHGREWWLESYRTYCEWCTNLDNYLECHKQVCTAVFERTEPEGVSRRRGSREQFPSADEYSDPEYPVYREPNQPSPPSLESRCRRCRSNRTESEYCSHSPGSTSNHSPSTKDDGHTSRNAPGNSPIRRGITHTNLPFIEDVERLENLLALEQSENVLQVI
ncbi:hypothetical protein CEXT_657651 [Caerostris extrusa]|uniref:Uncharacterized protein n=1 Tax=Caerostris extrusa TaxID=172846 RepID=A0AAV4M339_CAEEX|nr:hypothetical protein CEXT_657651 [Caerostris extrusa]